MQRGFTLIETVLYIGLTAIVLTTTTTFMIGMLERMNTIDPRTRMEEKSALIIMELNSELAGAQSVDVTQSTLGVTESALQFTNTDGEARIFQVVDETTNFVGGDQTVSRLQQGVDGVEMWLTDKDMEVTTFQVDEIRNGSNELVGLRINLILEGTAEEASTFNATTTIPLNGQTSEI